MKDAIWGAVARYPPPLSTGEAGGGCLIGHDKSACEQTPTVNHTKYFNVHIRAIQPQKEDAGHDHDNNCVEVSSSDGKDGA